VSGLQEYSETLRSFMPLAIKDVSVSSAPNPHVFVTLDTVAQSEQSGVTDGLYGNDVCGWGGNAEYQLGNGKRSNLAVPQHLAPLTGKIIPTSREASLTAGTVSPRPITDYHCTQRFLLSDICNQSPRLVYANAPLATSTSLWSGRCI
jgi:hypothetical protein